ncbi:MAG: DNA cytosine methyltransferase, partial [Candidatus Margulisiibacteriota bacterium]
MEFRLGELFCGPGGLGLGALNAKVSNSDQNFYITPIWATDYDKDACDTYHNNIHKRIKVGEVFCKDIKKIKIG